MGNPSNMHIRIPRPITRGKPITASWLNELRDAVQALNEKGFSLPSQQTKKVDPPRFNPLSIRKIVEGETVTFGVKVGFGVIVEIIPRGADPLAPETAPDGVMIHVPQITPMPTDDDPDPAPKPLDGNTEIIINDGDIVFVRYQTKVDGSIELEPGEGEEDKRPMIGSDSSPEPSTHYQPPNPGEEEADATKGDYYVRLFKISENPDTKATEIEYFCQSDIFHYHEVWRGKNTGDGAEVFKRRSAPDDVYEFRTLKGRYGIEENGGEDDILFDFYGENVGDGCPVFVEDEDGPADGPAQFRTIKQRPTLPQVTVICEPANPGDPLPDVITVQGNKVDGSLVTVDCEGVETTVLQWADGLITTSGPVPINLGECPGSSTEPPPP